MATDDRTKDNVLGNIDPDPDTRDPLPGSVDPDEDTDAPQSMEDITSPLPGRVVPATRQGTGAVGGDVGNRPEVYKPK